MNFYLLKPVLWKFELTVSNTYGRSTWSTTR